jgi:STAM-binding protein
MFFITANSVRVMFDCLRLKKNGQDILDNLGELKPTLVDRYDKWWRKRQEDGLDLDRTPNAQPQRTLDEERPQSQPDRLHTEQQSTRAREEQLMAEELDKWKQQRKEVEARDHARDQAHEARRKAAVHAAQKAVNRPKLPPAPDLTFSRTPMQNAGYGTQNTVVISDGRPSDEASRHRQHQEAMRTREDERARRQRRQEEDGIARWQREADDAARMARLNISNSSSSAAVPSGSAHYQFPPRIEYPTLQPNMPNPNPPDRQGAYVDPYRIGPSMLPIESPSRYEGDSTDSESVYRHNSRRVINTRVTEQKTPTRNLRR